MRYVSTRGRAPELGFSDVLLAGLASDGGLYVPATWPALPDVPPGATYAELACAIVSPFVGGAFGSCLRDRLQSRVLTCHGRPIAEAGVRTPCCQAKGETMASEFTRVHGRVLHVGALGPPLRLQVLDAGPQPADAS